MPRRPPVTLALVALATACAAPSSGGTAQRGVQVPSVNGLSTRTLISCRQLKGALPEEIGAGIKQVQANPVSDTTAAWGSPPISLRCGVEEGSDRDDPYTFNDVRWTVHDTGASRTWTTVGRRVNVSVEVPDTYSSQAELVGTVSFAVAKALR